MRPPPIEVISDSLDVWSLAKHTLKYIITPLEKFQSGRGHWNCFVLIFPPKDGILFDRMVFFLYHSLASKLDSRAGGAKGPSVRKVRAPQGKDNG